MRKPNKREAYILAGSTSTGETARVEADRTLRKPHVSAYLEKLQNKAMTKAVKTAEDIIRELELMGFSNIGNYLTFDKSGVSLKNSEELTPAQLSAVQEVSESVTKHGTKAFRFKLYDKKTPLEMLGRHWNLFTGKAQSGQTLASAVHEAMKER